MHDSGHVIVVDVTTSDAVVDVDIVVAVVVSMLMIEKDVGDDDDYGER